MPVYKRYQTPVLVGGTLVVLVSMAIWGGTTRPGPLFWTGVLLLATTLPAWGLLIWWLLFSPLPEETVRQGKGLSASGRQLVAIAMTISSILFLIGGLWDESWHKTYGTETVLSDFFWRPHQLIYISLGLTAGFAVAGLVVVLRRPGSLRARFRSEPTIALLALVALYLVIAAPIDALWHEIYGLDLTAWSLPHVVMLVGVTLVMLSAVMLQVSLVRKESWQRLSGLRRGEWLTLLLLTTTTIIFMLVAHSDWENAKAVNAADAFASAFWNRPDWLYPISILVTATFFGSIAQHALRRVGIASLLALLILGMRGLVALVFNLNDSALSMTFVSQFSILAPMIAMDIAFLFQSDKDHAKARSAAAMAALAAVTVISTPLLPQFLDYFEPDLGVLLGVLLAGMPVGLWFTWVGALIGSRMYETTRLTRDGVEVLNRRVTAFSMLILVASTIFVLYFIMTSTPPI